MNPDDYLAQPDSSDEEYNDLSSGDKKGVSGVKNNPQVVLA